MLIRVKVRKKTY